MHGLFSRLNLLKEILELPGSIKTINFFSGTTG